MFKIRMAKSNAAAELGNGCVRCRLSAPCRKKIKHVWLSGTDRCQPLGGVLDIERSALMYVIVGITGQIGGVVGRALLGARQPVRAVVRDAGKGREWAGRGCEVALANIEDAASLTAAFRGAEAAFVMVPSNFDPLPGFPEAQAIGVALKSALEAALPGRVVYLSTIGAQASQSNLLTQHGMIEQAISAVAAPLTVLRPAWFMENCSWDVAPARERGV